MLEDEEDEPWWAVLRLPTEKNKNKTCLDPFQELHLSPTLIHSWKSIDFLGPTPFLLVDGLPNGKLLTVVCCCNLNNTCNGWNFCRNGTTSPPKSILHYVVDKVKQLDDVTSSNSLTTFPFTRQHHWLPAAKPGLMSQYIPEEYHTRGHHNSTDSADPLMGILNPCNMGISFTMYFIVHYFTY